MDCDFNAAKLLSFDEALANIVAQASPVLDTEKVSVFDIDGRVLAEGIKSSVNLPPYDNSAMDGYAVNLGFDQQAHSLPVIDTSLAGHPAQKSLSAGESIRIMTGAKIPEGTTAVIMQENVTRTGDTIELNKLPKEHDNIRFTGEDIQIGSELFSEGHLLTYRDVALLSACGVSEVSVYKKVRIGLFSTGDELVEPGSVLASGQLYDSNRPMLFSMLNKLGVDVIDFGILEDNPDAIRAALNDASETSDIIITSGGVSVGDADYIKQILDELGEINFWKVAMKPGKPVAFGYLGQCAFIGLPGNPVSSAVTFDQLATPFIKTMQHHPSPLPKRMKALAINDFKKRPGRMDFQRGISTQNENGEWQVGSAGKQGSAILSAFSAANCHVLLSAESEGANKGDIVTIVLYQ
ncbi:molybdopterin molybdotransferase MoeA [Vibrio sp.]|nr:molybdopterin molybdotransferase MoeA [Vibrio sp.]